MRKPATSVLMVAMGSSVLGAIAWAVQPPQERAGRTKPQQEITSHAARQTYAAAALALPQPVVRVRLSSGESKRISLPIVNHTDDPVKILSVRTKCHCIRVNEAVLSIPARGKTEIPLLVKAALPGSQPVEINTEIGKRMATVQLLVDGRGRAVDIATKIVGQLDAQVGVHVLAILHDLRGEVRGCDCSASALGGLDRLATLQTLLPHNQTTWLASGESSSHASGQNLEALLDRLKIRGLLIGEVFNFDLSTEKRLSITASDRPLDALAKYDLIVATDTNTVRNSRVIFPRMSDGLGLDLVLLDRRGMPVAQEAVPLDDSLERDQSITTVIRSLRERIDVELTDENLSHGCRDCHQLAYQSWHASRHAKAFDSLARQDRNSSCASCHTTNQLAQQRARHVHCQACHQNAQAHQNDPRLKTVLVDCLVCHDSRHQAEFDFRSAWRAIKHSLDP